MATCCRGLRLSGRIPREGNVRCATRYRFVNNLTEADIEAFLKGTNYRLPRYDVLGEPQDARGLPESWCKKEAERFSRRIGSCIDTYDYFSIPEMVITDGYDDWPMKSRGRVLQA